MLTSSPTHEAVLELLTTKYQHWHYEQEVRAFLGLEEKDADTALYFTEFSDKLKLVQVIVGAESTITRAELRDALGKLSDTVSQVKARLAFRTYTVVEQNNAALWA